MTGFIVLILSFGSLLGAEAALRISQLQAFGTTVDVERSEKYYIDAETGLRLPVPGTVHGKMRFNALGFRSPEILVPKPPGVVRIAFLGSSTTLDAHAQSVEQTWPHLVIEHLRKTYPEIEVDYLNAGVPGMGSSPMLTYYEQFVANASPDIVVILANDQNRDLDELAISTGVHDGVHYRPSWLAQNSLFWAKLEKNGVVIQRMRDVFRSKGKLEIDPAALTASFEARLKKLVAAITDNNAEPVLLSYDNRLRREQSPDEQRDAVITLTFYMPYMSVGGFLAVQDSYNKALENVAGETGAAFVDWRNVVPGDAQHFIDSSHFTADGSRLMAAQVAKRLAEIPSTRERFQKANSL